MNFLTKISCIAVAGSAMQVASAAELIINGGFEAGLTGWTVTDQPGSSGSWFAASGTIAPLSGQPTVGPAQGTQYAVTDQTGPGTHALRQSFTVVPGTTSAILTFQMFVNSYGGEVNGPLDHTSGPVQIGRVDILSAGASAFDTGAGVLQNLYTDVDAGSNPHPYTAYTFDLTSLVGSGGTFQLRFAEADNQGFFNMGVDSVSLTTTVTSTVPEPISLALIGIGLAGIASTQRRHRKVGANLHC